MLLHVRLEVLLCPPALQQGKGTIAASGTLGYYYLLYCNYDVFCRSPVLTVKFATTALASSVKRKRKCVTPKGMIANNGHRFIWRSNGYVQVCRHRSAKKKKILIISRGKKAPRGFSLWNYNVFSCSHIWGCWGIVNESCQETREWGWCHQRWSCSYWGTPCDHSEPLPYLWAGFEREDVKECVLYRVNELLAQKKIHCLKLSSHLTKIWPMKLGNCLTLTNSCGTEVSCSYKNNLVRRFV